jgi:atypical dual specificity phosphatase
LGRTGSAYRKLRASFIDRPTNFGWIIEDSLAASGLPASASQVKWLREHGIKSILTLREEPLPKEFFEGTGVTSLHVEMSDHDPPAQESLSRAVGHVRREIEKGNAVLVHCLAGQGRTGTVLACYMVEYHGKEPGEAIAKLRKDRPGSVEQTQESAVHEYARRLKEAKRQR